MMDLNSIIMRSIYPIEKTLVLTRMSESGIEIEKTVPVTIKDRSTKLSTGSSVEYDGFRFKIKDLY